MRRFDVLIRIVLPLALLTVAVAEGPVKGRREPLKVAPRAFYIESCQRCHGGESNSFFPGRAKGSTAASLRADILRMSRTYIGEIADEDVEALSAYFLLSANGRPHLAWTSRKGLQLSGEASPGASLKATADGKPVPVRLDDGGRWSLVLPSPSSFGSLRMTATLNRRSSTLRFDQGSFARP